MALVNKCPRCGRYTEMGPEYAFRHEFLQPEYNYATVTCRYCQNVNSIFALMMGPEKWDALTQCTLAEQADEPPELIRAIFWQLYGYLPVDPAEETLIAYWAVLLEECWEAEDFQAAYSCMVEDVAAAELLHRLLECEDCGVSNYALREHFQVVRFRKDPLYNYLIWVCPECECGGLIYQMPMEKLNIYVLMGADVVTQDEAPVHVRVTIRHMSEQAPETQLWPLTDAEIARYEAACRKLANPSEFKWRAMGCPFPSYE